MTLRKILLAATAAVTLASGSAFAQPGWVPPGNDPGGYYSDSDHEGYYARDGQYHRMRGMGRFNRDRDMGPPPPPPGAYNGAYNDGPPPGAYYEQGRYEESCRRGNAAAGTIFGALAGGAIGAGVSRGNGGAVIGGAVLGGLLGNTISRDIDCDDQPEAFRVYATGLNGDIGRPYEWRGRSNRGTFTPVREFRRGDTVCRDFTETTYRGGQVVTRTGTACRERGGANWRFD